MAHYYGILLNVGIKDIGISIPDIEKILKASGIHYDIVYRDSDLIHIQLSRLCGMLPERIDEHLKLVLDCCKGFELRSLRASEVASGR